MRGAPLPYPTSVRISGKAIDEIESYDYRRRLSCVSVTTGSTVDVLDVNPARVSPSKAEWKSMAELQSIPDKS